MPKRLMMLTLSGIQEYISQSKKTSDLKISSDIIVEMITVIKEFLAEHMIGDLKISLIFEGDSKESKYHLDFLLAEVTCSDAARSPHDIELEISRAIRAVAENSKAIFPEEVSCYVAVGNALEHNYSYENAYDEVSRRMAALKNDRLNGIYFGDLFGSYEGKENLSPEGAGEKSCVVCNKRPGYIREGDEWFCEACHQKRHLQNSQKSGDYKFPSTWQIANQGLDERNASYYALIQLDLDDLGLYMSGNKGKAEDEQLLTYQKRLVALISEFRELLTIQVEKKGGTIIYCGGDDLLFFCSINKIWELLDFLDKLFRETLSSIGITYSISIVIAHCKDPLRHVVETSRRKLHEVKEVYQSDGKGGVSLTFLYQGSGVRSITVKDEEFCKCAGKLQEYFMRRKLSRSLIFVLEEELMPFGQNMNYDEYRQIGKMIYAELKRITLRKIQKLSVQDIQNPSPNWETQEIPENMTKLLRMFVRYTGAGYYIDMRLFFDLLYMLDKCAGICRELEKGNDLLKVTEQEDEINGPD